MQKLLLKILIRHPAEGQSNLYLLRSFGLQGVLLRTFFGSMVALAIYYSVACCSSKNMLPTVKREKFLKKTHQKGQFRARI